MARRNSTTDTQKKEYNTKIKITTLVYKDKDGNINSRDYATIISANCSVMESKNKTIYLRVPVNGEYSIKYLREYFNISDDEIKTEWLTAFLPNEKCKVPEAEKCRLNCGGVIAYDDKKDSFTLNMDMYSIEVIN